MTAKDDVRQFLVSRRAAITPDQVGLPTTGTDRRVPGLRREEVAALAGVSVEYYTRLERGNIGGASEPVLNAVASALRLNDVEREYLFDLARAVSSSGIGPQQPTPVPVVRASVQRMLNASTVPAIVQTPAQDIIAANPLGRAMYSPLFDGNDQPNFARFNYLDPRSQDFFVDWPWARRTAAAILRFSVGRDPANSYLTGLIAELAARSPLFVEDWARNDVHEHRTGVKSFRHPEVGVLEVAFDVFETPGDPNLQLVTYSAPAGTATAEKFTLLASWAATHTPAPARTGH
jgi:MmyB-like transcription regulator ligand binding domain/Helix-turn-helix domain